MWPTHCVQGSFGCEYHKDLVRKDSDKEIFKGKLKMVESYSGFGGDGEETGLDQYLKSNNVKRCFTVGLAYDYCVGSTAEDSAKHGYKTYLIDDAARSVADATKQTMSDRLSKAGVTVINLDQLQGFKYY